MKTTLEIDTYATDILEKGKLIIRHSSISYYAPDYTYVTNDISHKSATIPHPDHYSLNK